MGRIIDSRVYRSSCGTRMERSEDNETWMERQKAEVDVVDPEKVYCFVTTEDEGQCSMLFFATVADREAELGELIPEFSDRSTVRNGELV